VEDFRLGNPPGFPQGDVVKARRIYAVVDATALWHRQVVIKSLELNDLAINLLSDVRGKWNFENPPTPAHVSKTAASEPSSFTLGVISKVSMSGGELRAATLLASGRPGPTFFEARAVAIDLEDVDLNAFIAPTAASFVPPENSPDWLARAGLGATLLYAAAPPPTPAAQGTLKAQSLRFGTLQATSVRSKLRLFPKQVYFDDLNFDLYGGRAAGSLSFNFAGQNPRYSTNVRISGVDVAKLLEAIPEARGKMTGTMEARGRGDAFTRPVGGDARHGTSEHPQRPTTQPATQQESDAACPSDESGPGLGRSLLFLVRFYRPQHCQRANHQQQDRHHG
jgi:hypothetical protein